MIIGPGEPDEGKGAEKPRKRKGTKAKKVKGKAARQVAPTQRPPEPGAAPAVEPATGDDSASAGDPAPAPEPSPAADPAPGDLPPRVGLVQPEDDLPAGAADVGTPAAPGYAAPRTPSVAGDPGRGPGGVPRAGSVVDRIDALRARVEALLAIADGRDELGRPAALPPDGLASGAPAPDHPAPSHVSPPVVADAVDPAAAPAPGESAVLVARELLSAGMTPATVGARLRDAYGVADPEAVLAAVR